MYQVGQRIVTDLGVGDILRIEHERYYVYIEFPSDNTHSYETWITDSDIRYSYDTKDDYRRVSPEDDNRITRSLKQPRAKKPKSVYRHGRYTTVWR
jgi:hypothetical protein